MRIFYSHPTNIRWSKTQGNSIHCKKGHPENTRDAHYNSHLPSGKLTSIHLEASALPASSVPLPASFPRAFVGAEAALAWSLREEECAAAGAPAAEPVAVAEPEPVGSGSARADCSAAPQADDSLRGGYWVDSARAGYWVESARDDYLVVPRADDSLRGGYWVDSARADCSAAPQADDSARAGYWVESARDDYLVVPRGADSPRGGCWVDSARDDCSVVPRAADSPRGGYSVALEPVDFPVGLPVG